jgi:endonuclease YncB( thermonuclease family)
MSDGDTITVLDGSKQQHKMRLEGIDEPESAQAFGQKSKQSLSD